MKRLPFKKSASASIGIELEYQIIDTQTFALASKSKEIIRHSKDSNYDTRITPEITQGMIEINSSIHDSAEELFEELLELQAFLLNETGDSSYAFCGGGTHPFQAWSLQKIFPTTRYKNLSHKFRFLSKRGTVFGFHIHVGCTNPEDALYLTHAFARFVPQFIAISASSPFYNGVDTGFHASRPTIINSLPMTGTIPYLTDWTEFSDYFYKMRQMGIIESMKDIYWDIRPKPEFGTVELRIFDTPLTIKKAVIIAAYVQTLARFLLAERPALLSQELYYLYSYNRFQAGRYGYEGIYYDPYNNEKDTIKNDLLNTLDIIQNYTHQPVYLEYLNELKQDVIDNRNDAILIREIMKKVGDYPQTVAEQCNRWIQNE